MASTSDGSATGSNTNDDAAAADALAASGDARFGKFIIPSDSIFYRSPGGASVAFVNLRPIVPGHVLVIPRRVAPLMADLDDDEYLDVWKTVRVVQGALGEHYENCTAFNVAVQDGYAAGQSVPHVHVHVLPRTAGDYERNDDIYTDLERWAPRPRQQSQQSSSSSQRPHLDVAADADRRDRTAQEMADEAAIYRRILEPSSKES